MLADRGLQTHIQLFIFKAVSKVAEIHHREVVNCKYRVLIFPITSWFIVILYVLAAESFSSMSIGLASLSNNYDIYGQSPKSMPVMEPEARILSHSRNSYYIAQGVFSLRSNRNRSCRKSERNCALIVPEKRNYCRHRFLSVWKPRAGGSDSFRMIGESPLL
jgi:hypothetical protein